MLKLRSIVHEVAWQFNNLACGTALMFGQVISTIAFRSLFSSNRLSKEQNYTEIILKHVFFNHAFRFCEMLDKSWSKQSSLYKSCNIKFLAPA